MSINRLINCSHPGTVGESDDDLQWKVCMGCSMDHILGPIKVGWTELAAKLPKDYVAMTILCPAEYLGLGSGVGAVLISSYIHTISCPASWLSCP